MAPDLFRIETDQTELNWSGGESPLDEQAKLPEGRLAVFAKKDQTIKVWREAVPPEAAENRDITVGPRLYEQITYTFLLLNKANRRVELRHRDPTITHALSPSPDGSLLHGTINFGSQIGRSRFEVYVAGKPEFEFEVEVFPSKLDYASDYNAIVADVQDILAALVLEYLRSTFKLGLATHSKTTTRLEWILLLRHVVDDLERGLRYVERHPHHGLTRERALTRIEKLRRPDATILKLIVQGKGKGPKSRTASGLELHSALPERRARTTLNTPEHRWLASQLTRIRRTLAQIHLSERKRDSMDRNVRVSQPRIIEEIAALENRIAVLQTLDPIAQAEGLAPAGFTSLTLQAQPGYREAYRACLILLLGLRVNGGPVGLSVKDIHVLYEYWCYLALVRLIAEITGERLPARRLLSHEQDGLRVQLKRGNRQTVKFSTNKDRSLELAYNPLFRGRGFILPQQPDIVLTFRDREWPTMRLVLDAKYRINSEATYVKHSPGPPDTAIDVLHRYRDAILEETGAEGPRSETFKRNVVEGVALFPFADVNDEFRESRFWTSLERLGIGAIPFLPSEMRYLEEWLRAVLKRGGWSTAERVIPYLSHEQLRTWQEAEKEAVLIGVLRQEAKEHLDWIKQQRVYYTPRTSQPRQLVSRWVAIYSPASLRSPGAVTHLGKVENMTLKKRGDIDTPWTTQRNPDDEQVVYQLGEVQELPKRIENRGPAGLGERFSNNRWTSRLAIDRASELRELFLETSREWRLYEQLRVAGVDFTLHPGAAKVQDKDEPFGRTWFVTKRREVQYRGEGGFLIRTAGMREEWESDLAKVVERMSS